MSAYTAILWQSLVLVVIWQEVYKQHTLMSLVLSWLLSTPHQSVRVGGLMLEGINSKLNFQKVLLIFGMSVHLV